MDENMDTSPTGPDFYSSPSSPASSRANWHDRDGGDSPVFIGALFIYLWESVTASISPYSYTNTQSGAALCRSDDAACWQNVTRDQTALRPHGMQIDPIRTRTSCCFLTSSWTVFTLSFCTSLLPPVSLRMYCIWFPCVNLLNPFKIHTMTEIAAGMGSHINV